MDGDWEKVDRLVIVGAAVLDGLDGRIARLLKGESRFGAELDSLSDVIAFGVAPALIHVSLVAAARCRRFGWLVRRWRTRVCCALQARAVQRGDRCSAEQPHKSAGFLTGVPAPAAAGLAMLPVYPVVMDRRTAYPPVSRMGGCAMDGGGDAMLMVSNVATCSCFSSLKRPRRDVRFEACWWLIARGCGGADRQRDRGSPRSTLCLALCYVGSIPFGIAELREGQAAARHCRRRHRPADSPLPTSDALSGARRWRGPTAARTPLRGATGHPQRTIRIEPRQYRSAASVIGRNTERAGREEEDSRRTIDLWRPT